MMKIPKKIYYDGHIYKVKQLVHVDTRQAKKEKVLYLGVYSYKKQTVKIRKTLPQTQKEQSLLHELLHMVDYHNKGDLTEQQVNYLAKDLYGVLKTNKFLR